MYKLKNKKNIHNFKLKKLDYLYLYHEKLPLSTVKPVLSSHSQKDRKLVFKTDYRLMQVKSIAECSKGSIRQYFRPSLTYHLPLRPFFCLFLSGWPFYTVFTVPVTYVFYDEIRKIAIQESGYPSQ